MSSVDDLTQQLCPNGVPFKTLGEVITHLRTGLNPRKNFELNPPGARNYYVTVRELAGLDVVFSEKTDRVDDVGLAAIDNRAQLKAGDVLFSATGTIGRTALVKTDPLNWGIKEGIYAITPDSQFLDSKFLIYLLGESSVARQIVSRADGSIVVSVPMASLRQIKIPVPPLEVQREIVRVLDLFSGLTAYLATQLDAEQEARRLQYGYYRDRFFAFPGAGVRWVPMGEVGDFIRGRRFTKNDVVEEGIPSVHYGEIYTTYGIATAKTASHVREDLAPRLRYAKPGDVVIAAVGETVEDVGRAVAWLGTADIAIHDDCFLYRSNVLEPKFVSYYLRTEALNREKAKYVARAKVKRLSGESLAKLMIPVPSLKEQKQIVAILDRFDALVTDLSGALPAEVTARRKQYEYYRDRLLTFGEMAA